MNNEQNEMMSILSCLSGVWVGEGTADYPTTAASQYREELTFTYLEEKPYLHYNQRTWRKREDGMEIHSHWETGFWRVLGTNEIELVCAQSGGRVEVDRGLLIPTQAGFTLELHSVLLGKDPRVEHTRRVFSVNREILTYALEMQTNLVPALTAHVSAELKRMPTR